MAGARGRAAYNMHNAPYAHPSSSSSSSSFNYNNQTGFAKRSFNQGEFQKLKQRRGDGPDMELRLLVRGRNAGAIIGKSGSNIRRIKHEFGVGLFLTDTNSPERILSIMGFLGSICEAVLDLIPVINNNLSSEVTDDVDVRILMHASFTGHIIGKRAHGIRDLQKQCNTKIQVYHNCCPRSTDRVVQINGSPVDVVNCIATIVDLVIEHPPIGLILPYDPNNFIEIRALDYGGFTSYDVTVPFQGEAVSHGLGTSQTGASNPTLPSQPDPHRFRGADVRHGWAQGRGHPNPEMSSSSLNHGNSFRPAGPNAWETAGQPFSGSWVPNSSNQNPNRSTSTDSSANYDGRGQNPIGQNQSFVDHKPEYSKFESRASEAVGNEARGETSLDHPTDPVATQRSLHARFTRARPLDKCPGLGFFPVDAQTVQVSIPKALQTVVMGRRGAAIREIRSESRATIVIEVPPAGASERYLTLVGTPEQLQKAQYLLQCRYIDGKQRFADDPEGFMSRGVKLRNRPDAPWMNDDIVKMKLMRRKLERVWRAAKTDETKKAFRDYSVEMNKAINRVKHEYYKIHGGAPENKRRLKQLEKLKLKMENAKKKDETEAGSSQGDLGQEDDDGGSDDCQSSDEDGFEDIAEDGAQECAKDGAKECADDGARECARDGAEECAEAVKSEQKETSLESLGSDS